VKDEELYQWFLHVDINHLQLFVDIYRKFGVKPEMQETLRLANEAFKERTSNQENNENMNIRDKI